MDYGYPKFQCKFLTEVSITTHLQKDTKGQTSVQYYQATPVLPWIFLVTYFI